MYKRWRSPFILILSFAVVVGLAALRGYVYGSTIDWFSQHVALAETIRNACLEQKTLLPTYLPLGGGSNGFMFSYYGYLRPDILLGCLFPQMPMMYLLIGYMLLGYLTAVLLFYKLLLEDGAKEFMAFWGSMLFLLAACFFHTHRQVMFINYMPYLLAALLLIKRKKYIGVCFFLTLVYCNSFYYAIAVLAAVGWSWYREEGKSFFLMYVKTAALSIGMAAALLVPTGLVILEHRREGAALTVGELLLDGWDFSSLLYSPYGMGLTAVCFYGLILGLGMKRLRADSVCYLLVSGMGVAAWILNGTLYARGKILIPFMPLVVLQCVRVFERIREENRMWKLLAFLPLAGITVSYIGRKRFAWIMADVLVLFSAVLLMGRKRMLKPAYLMLLVLPACFYLKTEGTEDFVSSRMAEEIEAGWTADIRDIEEETAGDDRDVGLYRFDSIYEPLNTANRNTFEGRQKSAMYSSIYHAAYSAVYYDLLMTPVQINNRMALLAADNPFLLSFLGERYVQTTPEQIPDGYEVVEKRGNTVIAENEKVLPIAYLTSACLNRQEFEKLDAYEKLDALMQRTIVDTDTEAGKKPMDTEDGFQSRMRETDISFASCTLPEGLCIDEAEPGIYELKVKGEQKLTLELTAPVREKILLLSFAVDNQGDEAVVIDINGIRNKLSGKRAAYPNKNNTFHYQFLESDEDGVSRLEILLSEGKYRISEVQWHVYEREFLYQKEITEVKPLEAGGNELISCRAGAAEDTLFVTSIPRQRGMEITIDGRRVLMLTVNEAFVGARVPAGVHEIKIVFYPPGLRLGYGISIVSTGLVLMQLFYACVLRRKRMSIS